MKVLIVFAFIGVVQSNMTSPVVIIGGKNGGKMVMKEINDPKIGLLTTVLFSEWIENTKYAWKVLEIVSTCTL